MDARGGAAVAGEAGTIKLTCSQVTVTGEYPISQHGLFGGPVAPKASGRQGHKFASVCHARPAVCFQILKNMRLLCVAGHKETKSSSWTRA